MSFFLPNFNNLGLASYKICWEGKDTIHGGLKTQISDLFKSWM